MRTSPRVPAWLQVGFSLCLVSTFAGCTPKQGEEVALTQLFTDAKLHKKEAMVTGILGISVGMMGSTSCKAGRCNLELRVPDAGWKAPPDLIDFVNLSVSVGSGENEMAELPDKYARTDLAVKAMGGKVLKAGDRVKVSGPLKCHGNNGEDHLPCSMYVERIDAL